MNTTSHSRSPFSRSPLPLGLLLLPLLGGCGEEAATPASPTGEVSEALEGACRSVPGLEATDTAANGSAARLLRSCVEKMAGTWTLDSSALPDLEAALDSAVAPYPTQAKASVRTRLAEVARQPLWVRVSVAWPLVGVDDALGDGRMARLDGSSQVIPSGEEELVLSSRWTAGSMLRIFEASDGQREDAYSLDSTGRGLTLVESVSGGRLLRPLVLRLRYRR